jgi:uncharacterized MnhB-related membrane protein
MAKKVLVVYIVYTVIVFLTNTYIFKEAYSDALIKAVLSGVLFTTVYAFIVMRNEKKQEEKKLAEKKLSEKKPARKKK